MKKLFQSIKKVDRAEIGFFNGVYTISVEANGLFPFTREYFTIEKPNIIAGQFICNLDTYYSIQNELLRSLQKFFKEGLHTKNVQKHIKNLFNQSLIGDFNAMKAILKEYNIIVDFIYGHYYITCPKESPNVVVI